MTSPASGWAEPRVGGMVAFLELLAREAPTIEFERPVLEARTAGATPAEIDALMALTEPGRPDVPADPQVLETLVLTFSGALLQAGMGVMTYDAMASRLESATAVIVRGHDRDRG